MRTISTTLLKAQQSAIREPYVRVEITPRELEWTRLYNGQEPDGFHAATIATDGSLIRAWSIAGQVYLQRVPNPGPEADFTTWTLLLDGVSTISGLALCVQGNSVLLFFVNGDGKTICYRESSDNGLTFDNPSVIAVAVDHVNFLAADGNGRGAIALFYNDGNYVYVVKRNGEQWDTPSQWTNGSIGCSGLAVCYNLDWNVLVSGGTSSEGFALWQCIYGDGYGQSQETWSALTTLEKSSGGLSVEFHLPSIVQADTFRLVFEERYLGNGGYSRPYISQMPAGSEFNTALWREPAPFDLSTSFGTALCGSADYLWLSTPWAVWRAALSPGTITDVSDDVLHLRIVESPFEISLSLELRNNGLKFGSPGLSGSVPVKKGMLVTVDLGYCTSQGLEVSPGMSYLIESIGFTSDDRGLRLVLLASGGWHMLREWKARRQFVWEGNMSIFGILREIFAKAGIPLSCFSYSSMLMARQPSFTINPGESALSAVRRLLRLVEDRVIFRGGSAYVVYPQASDPSVYSYGPDHAIESGSYLERTFRVNAVQVWGRNVFGEAFAWSEAALAGERLAVVRDHNMATLLAADDRATIELRAQSLASYGGYIVCPTNCGQELYDLININDSHMGNSSFPRRVMGIATTFDRESEAQYSQRISLGGV